MRLRLTPGKLRLLATPGALIAALVLILTWVPHAGSRRLPSASDTVFGYFAEHLGEADLCEKISWAAMQRYSVLFGGGGASFARSDCYEQIALESHDRSLCWNVRPLIDGDPFSAGYSALSCSRRVGQGDVGSAILLAPEALVRAFATLGYDVDTLHLEGGIEPAIRPSDVYRSLQREPGIVDRVAETLSRPGAPLDAGDRSFLAHLAAVAASDASWCERIPASQPLATEAVPFRDWCYLTVAFDSQDARVCARMAPAATEAKVRQAESHGVRPDIAEQFSARAQCARIDHWLGPFPHYGPEVPTDALQIQRPVAALGLTMPLARNWPPYQIAAYYARFVDGLRADRPTDSAHAAARAKLVARIAARAEFP